MAATVTKNQEFLITENQSRELAIALKDVMQHYSIPISAEALAWLKLGGIATAIYGPKVARVVKAKAENRRQAQAMQKAAQDHVKGNAMQVTPPAATDPNNPAGVYRYQ